jgi:hypothetical protein
MQNKSLRLYIIYLSHVILPIMRLFYAPHA